MNDKPKNELRLTPHQLAAMLVLDAQVAQLQIGANQLGGFLGLKREADILVNAIQVIQKDKERLVESWAKTIQIVPASALPPPPVIQGVIP